MKRLTRTVMIALSLAMVAAACSGVGTSGTAGDTETVTGYLGGNVSGEQPMTTTAAATTDGGAAPTPQTDDKSGAGANGEPLGSGGVDVSTLTPTDLGRDIVFTADMTVAVNDVAAAGAQATRVIQGLGGFLYGQQTQGGTDPRSVLVFKVFPKDFQTALDRLGAIGDLRTQNVSADDVTDRLVDLQSRITTAEASVARLRALLASATDVDVVAKLENQLLERETNLETLRGQQRTLENQVSLATISVTLIEATTRPEIRLETTTYLGHDTGLSCPGGNGLQVEEGGDATLCFEITNVGDTRLTGLALRDTVLDITLEDVTVVYGDPTETLEPGQSVMLAYETTAPRDIRTRTNVTALPVDEAGQPLPGRDASATTTVFIDAYDPGGIPTFTEGLSKSWEALVRFGAIMLLMVGWMIPFVWIPLGLWGLYRWLRRPSKTTPTPAEQTEPTPDTADV